MYPNRGVQRLASPSATSLGLLNPHTFENPLYLRSPFPLIIQTSPSGYHKSHQRNNQKTTEESYETRASYPRQQFTSDRYTQQRARYWSEMRS